MERILVKPSKGLLVRKSQAEGFRHYKTEGEEVNKTKDVVRLLRHGDLVLIESPKQFKKTKTKK